MGKAYEYGVLIKPKVLVAMVLLYATSFFTSHATMNDEPFGLKGFLLGLVAVTSAVSGANALNCFIDSDIDALMTRTLGRPLVRGTIGPSGALYFSGVLLAVGMLISGFLGPIPFLLFLEGTGTYLLLYTVVLKKRTSLNVLATAPSVAAPAWFGWYMGGAPIYPVGLLLGALVAVWGPLHLWSLAYAYSNDYLKANIPMLSATSDRRWAVKRILTVLTVLIVSSYTLTPWSKTQLYIIGTTLLNALLAVVGYRLWKGMSKRDGWVLFKLTAPYIVLVLILFMTDKLLTT